MYCQILCLWSHNPPPPKHPCAFCNLFSSPFNSYLPATFSSLMLGHGERDGSLFQYSEPQRFGVEPEGIVWSASASAAQSLACAEGDVSEFIWLSKSEGRVCKRRFFHGEQQKARSRYLSDLCVQVPASRWEGYCFSSSQHTLWLETSNKKGFFKGTSVWSHVGFISPCLLVRIWRQKGWVWGIF